MNVHEIKNWTLYLRQCTDAQLQGVYDKETANGHDEEASLVVLEATRRGVTLDEGEG